MKDLQQIIDLLHDYRLRYCEIDGESGSGYPLVDALSGKSDDTKIGEMEIEALAEYLYEELE